MCTTGSAIRFLKIQYDQIVYAKTNGNKQIVAIVITVSVYEVDEAFWIKRSYLSLMLEIITRGNIPTKIIATNETIVKPLEMKANISLPLKVAICPKTAKQTIKATVIKVPSGRTWKKSVWKNNKTAKTLMQCS